MYLVICESQHVQSRVDAVGLIFFFEEPDYGSIFHPFGVSGFVIMYEAITESLECYKNRFRDVCFYRLPVKIGINSRMNFGNNVRTDDVFDICFKRTKNYITKMLLLC